MSNLKIFIIVATVVCIFLASGYIIFTHQNKSIKESKLVVTEIDYNEMLGTGSLTSIFQDKAVCYITFIKSRSVDGGKYIIYAENGTNNLSISEISALFNASEHVITDNYTYTIHFSDKSHLTTAEFENLLGTIDSSGFPTFADSYTDNDLLDATDTFLVVNLSGAVKTVHEYGDGAPNGFHQIKNVIRNVIDARWGDQ